jgi:NAD(P)H-nitrite reductase large subunit
LLADLGRTGGKARVTLLRRQVARQRWFQTGLAHAFSWPASQAGTLPDDVILCRCEAVTAGEVRKAIAAPLGPREVNRAKAITRCGMGRCQGRFCGPALQEVVAAACGREVSQVGRLRAQGPVKPIPIGIGLETVT